MNIINNGTKKEILKYLIQIILKTLEVFYWIVINTVLSYKQTLDILSTKNKQYFPHEKREEKKRFSKTFEDGSNADWTESRNGTTALLLSVCMYFDKVSFLHLLGCEFWSKTNVFVKKLSLSNNVETFFLSTKYE